MVRLIQSPHMCVDVSHGNVSSLLSTQAVNCCHRAGIFLAPSQAMLSGFRAIKQHAKSMLSTIHTQSIVEQKQTAICNTSAIKSMREITFNV